LKFDERAAIYIFIMRHRPNVDRTGTQLQTYFSPEAHGEEVNSFELRPSSETDVRSAVRKSIS
jgi:hypothetical protein